MSWRDGFEIVWHGSKPDGVEETVRADILTLGVSKPENLITHCVLLGDDMEGPSVSVWGVEGDERFHAEYDEVTGWVTLAGPAW